MSWRPAAIVAACLCLASCAHVPTDDELRKSFDRTRKESHFATEPSMRAASGIGVGLSGGGTRAAATSIGILWGLQEAGVLQHVDVISSVSGGGYGAYWWYSRFLDGERGFEGLVSSYADCLPRRFAAIAPQDTPSVCGGGAKGLAALCPASFSNYCPGGDPYRHQNHLRGFQDVLRPGRFDYGSIYDDGTDTMANVLSLLGQSVLAAAPNFVANIVFDWQVNVSPSLRAYVEGIHATYGTRAKNCDEIRESCVTSRPLTASPKMTWKGLQSAWKAGAPLWVMNAHAGSGRSGLDLSPPQHPEKASFEFTPFSFGSSVYNFHSAAKLDPDFTVAEGVVASAAFFSAQQKVIEPPGRNILNVLMLATAVNWGVSIPNPRVGRWQRLLHMALPFPLYYLYGFRANENSADINLADGGLADNLGAYALFKRGLPVWILSDHSFDRAGTMQETCKLKKTLRNLGYDVLLPGLKRLEEVCASEGKLGYDIFDWTHPILLGCVTGIGALNCNGAPYRIILIKPALNGHLARTGETRDGNRDQSRDAWRQVAEACGGGLDIPACRNRVSELLACSSPVAAHMNVWKFDTSIPCEVLGFLLINGFGRGVPPTDRCPAFPQNSSTIMTVNSSHSLYGAYRELMRWYGRQLKFLFPSGQLDGTRFSSVLHQQSLARLEPVDVKGGVSRFLAPKAGEHDNCLFLGSSGAQER